MEYRQRIIDRVIAEELEAFGAIWIVGPKWCGKTTSASMASKSILRLQDPDKRETLLNLSKLKPSELLKGEKPRLIDEWQIAPNLWDAVKTDVDITGDTGQYILTGSRKPINERPMNSGTGRISKVRMNTMSLFESGDSSGSVSLKELFDGVGNVEGTSSATLDNTAELVVRGGWPQSIGRSKSICRSIIRGYCRSITDPDVSTFEGVKISNPNMMKDILRSLSRLTSSPMSKKTIIGDISSKNDSSVSVNTLNSYLSILSNIYVLDVLPSWNPNLRSKTAIRTTDVVHFCDPAIAAYFLSASPEDLVIDPNTFGLLFESTAVRDLRIYANALDGEVYHYHDKNGLEADAVIHLHDGRWGAVEVKLGEKWVEEAAVNLNKLKEKVADPPSFLAVVTAAEYAYTREDGIHVIPLACLKD